MKYLLYIVSLVSVLVLAGCAGIVDEGKTKQFLADLGDTSITVYPTYIKRMAKDNLGKPLGEDASNSGYELNETQRLAAFLRCECLADVTVSSDKVPLNSHWQRTQYGIFKASTRAFGDYVAAHPIETRYAIMAEYIIPHDRIWAVHAYVVDASGQPVWILHLNEHFDVFTAINPVIPADGTRVLLDFLRDGWPDTSAKCMPPYSHTAAAETPAGVLYPFDTELPAGRDRNGVPLGFSTFSDDNSTVTLSLTTDHPPRPGEAAGNSVMKLSLDVKGWGGVVNTLTNDAADAWVPRDWSDHDSFSFWLYGNNSGTPLYVDLLDNRKRCSTHDDAERFTYSFVDDFSGWKHLTFRFADMAHRDIGNRAPDDGLGLTHVHGWGFGVAGPGGPMTFYIDDFALHAGTRQD